MNSLFRRLSAPGSGSGSKDASRRSSSTVILPSVPFVQETPTPRRAPPGPHSVIPERRWPAAVPTLPQNPHEHGNDRPVFADFDAPHFVVGGGVAIFHLATARVVLCWHTRDRYWFLPKGRRDAGEESGAGAEREGYEESGFRNRLLPLPLAHKQPRAAAVTVPLSPSGAEDLAMLSPSQAALITEPVLTQLLPVTRHRQYLLQWYIAETIPPSVEARVNAAVAQAAAARGVNKRDVYVRPPAFPKGLTLRARIEQDSIPVHNSSSREGSREASFEPDSKPASSSPPDSATIGIATDSRAQPIPKEGQAQAVSNPLGMEGVLTLPEPGGTRTINVRGAQFEMSPALAPGGWAASGRRWVANQERVEAWTDHVDAAGGSPPLGALLGSPNPNIDAVMSPDPNAFAGPAANKKLSDPSVPTAAAPPLFHTPQPVSGEWAAMHRAEQVAAPGVGVGLGIGSSNSSGDVARAEPKGSAPSSSSSHDAAGETEIYMPHRHPNTGVDDEEALYTSELVPVEVAVRRLEGSGMERVVRIGWEAICRRWADEEREANAMARAMAKTQERAREKEKARIAGQGIAALG